MSITALLELRLKPDGLASSLQVVNDVLVATRAFAGNEGVEVLIDTADPAHIIVHETWASLEADSSYRAWRATQGGSGLAEVLAAPPVLTVLTPQSDS